MRKFLFMAICMMVLCVGVTSCGSDDEAIERKHEISEWNNYVKTLNFIGVTRVKDLYMFYTNKDALEKDRTAIYVEKTNTSAGANTYLIKTVSAETFINRAQWIEFKTQQCEGTIKIVDTNTKDISNNEIYDITLQIKEMKDTKGKWAENINIHCKSPIGKMLTY